MDRWKGRVALVTGASSGIGKAIASRLAHHGMKVIACGRNMERLMELSAAHSSASGAIVAVQCDLADENDVMAMFDRVRGEFGAVDVCVNNAGIGHNASLLTGTSQQWRELLNVNVLAPCICTRESVKTMKERGVNDGVIINIGSISGQGVLYEGSLGGFIYVSSKHALRAISQGLGSELRSSDSGIRVTEISPGLVRTEIIERSRGKDTSDFVYKNIEPMEPEDIADSVVYALSAPPRAQVAEIIIRTTAEIKMPKKQ